MKIKLFSWNVYELWEQEWPQYREVLWKWKLVFLRGPRHYGWRLWLSGMGHRSMDLVVEFFRVFAYTIGHLLVWGLAVFLLGTAIF